MSFESSMVYTMGTALSRALEHHATVEVLADGAWLSGAVVLYDGYGVVLDNTEEHAIVKVDQITAVRVHSMSPMRQSIEPTHLVDFGEAVPMGGARMAAAS